MSGTTIIAQDFTSLTSQSIVVMPGRSVHLNTLFS